MTLFFRTFIRVLGFLSAFMVFILLVSFLIIFFSDNKKNNNFSYSTGDQGSLNKIAILNLNGPILNDPIGDVNFLLISNFDIIFIKQVKKLLEELETQNIKGLVISINSPGGTVSASKKLYDLFINFKIKNSVKIYFHTNELIASGAYWAALSGDKIYADYGSLIGSIGVKGPDWIYYDNPIAISSGLIGNSIETKNGIKTFSNIAGNSKDLFNPFRPPTTKEIADLQNSVQNIYEDFVIYVSKSRKLEKNFITNDLGAMIYDSKTAKQKFLIDDVLPLNKVVNLITENLELKDFQIIENYNNEISFLENLIYKNFFNNQIYENNNLKEQSVCKIIKYQLSSIVIQKRNLLDC